MTTLKKEEAFAFAGKADKLPDMCSFCFVCNEAVSKCKGCHMLYYCDRDCQKKDWVNPKKECLLLKTFGRVPTATVRLVARILLKSETSLAQKSFNDRSWDSLDYHKPNVNDEAGKLFIVAVSYIGEFMKPLKNISREDIIKTLGKVQKHKLDIFDETDIVNCIGTGIYLGLSVHKQSCISDSQLLFAGTTAVLRSVDQTKTAYSPNLTLSYTGLPPWNLNRKAIFKDKYFIDCTCPICVDENHIFNRMGSSCYVSCCMDAVGLLDVNSGRYKCNKCGKTSKITVDDVKCAESKIQSYLVIMEDPFYTFNIMDVKRLLHETEKVLSLYNYHSIYFWDKIVVAANFDCMPKQDAQILTKQLSDKKMKACRYYLHEMDMRMAAILVDRAALKLALDYLDDFDVAEALEVAERALGELHPAIVHFKQVLEVFRVRNAQMREEQFREAANFKW